jgi:hypothetical protein
MKEHLQGMERADRKHLDPPQYWDLNGKAAVEARHISERLIPESVNRFVSEGKTDAEEAWAAFALDLKAHYIGKHGNPEPTIMSRARGGDYERESPSPGNVSSMVILFWVAAAFELFVFTLQGMFGGSFNIVILLQAALLATGGYLIGSGLGQILYKRWCTAYLSESLEAAKMSAASIALGVLVIVTIGAFRAYGAGDPLDGSFAFVITALLGSICALFETRYVALKHKRDRLLLLEGQGQAWLADRAHEQRLNEYRRVYLGRFRAASKPGGLVADPPPLVLQPKAAQS